MTSVSFIIKAHLGDDRCPLIGGAAKNPYRLLKSLARIVTVPRVIYFEGDQSGAEPYRARRFGSSWMKLYAKTLYQNLVSAVAVWEAFRESDIVQCHHPHYGLVAAGLRRWIFRDVRFVVKAHGTALPEFEANKYRRLKGWLLRLNARLHLKQDRFVLANADAVLCSSEFQRREMIELYGIKPAIISCIYNGFEVDYQRPALLRRASAARRRFVFCGRVVPKKGIPYAIALFQAIARNTSEFELLLILACRDAVEDMETYRHVQRLAASDPRIVIAHDLTEPELYERFASSDIGLAPSQNYESIPTVVIEMLAAGLPVFATYKWGIPEVLPECFGLNGDIEADATKIATYLELEDRSFATLVAEVRHRFNYGELVQAYCRLYASLIHPQAAAVTSNSGSG